MYDKILMFVHEEPFYRIICAHYEIKWFNYVRLYNRVIDILLSISER